jgi:hypothetical protein
LFGRIFPKGSDGFELHFSIVPCHLSSSKSVFLCDTVINDNRFQVILVHQGGVAMLMGFVVMLPAQGQGPHADVAHVVPVTAHANAVNVVQIGFLAADDATLVHHR